MRKGLAFLSVAVTVGVFGVAAAACSDSSPASGFGDNGDSGAQFDTGPGFNTDAAALSETGGPVVCNPSLPANFAPAWKAATKASVCAAGDAKDFYDACAPDLKAKTCVDWIAAHKACDACLEATDGNGPIQPHRDRLFWTLNVAGCASLILTSDTCPKAYSAYFDCTRQSCEDCFGQSGAKFTDFQKCEAAAQSTGCTTYDNTQKSACVGMKDPDGGAPTCFPTTAEAAGLNGTADQKAASNRDYTVRVAEMFCGP
jgi:hypothetical protein